MSYNDLEKERPRPYLEIPIPEPKQPSNVEDKPEPKRVIIIDPDVEDSDIFTIDL